MSTLGRISSNLKFAEAKKHDLRKALEDLQSHSSSLASLTLQWEDLRTYFDSIQSSIERQFERLASKEMQLRSLQIALDRRAKELELKEWEFNRPIVQSGVKSEPLEDVPVDNQIGRSSSHATLRFYVTMDGRNLQFFLNNNSCNHGKMGNEVFAALRMSADPAKLVLDAMEGFYPPHVKNGAAEFETATVRRSCVLLLRQLTRVGAPISPQVREEAARLAHEWKSKMGVELRDSLELLGFLWLLGAYGLTSVFDKNEILKLFANVLQHKQAHELSCALGLTNCGAGGSILPFQVLMNQPPSKNMELKNADASSPIKCWPELKVLCINMDGKGLRLFLNEHVKEHDSIRSEVYHALQFAPDPAALVVDILQVFDDPGSELNKGFKMDVVRKSCILLLEQLFRISPSIEPHVKEAALKLAVDLKEKFVKKFEVPQKVLGFYLLLAVYGLTSSFDPEELLGLLMNTDHSEQLKVTPDLCSVLGLEDKIPNYIQDLIERNLLSDAIRYIHAFELVDKFPPVSILKSYLNDLKWRKLKTEKNLHLAEDDLVNEEMMAMREVISCIIEHNLESEYPLMELEKRIEQLEKKIEGREADKKYCPVPEPQPPEQNIADPRLPKQNAPEPQEPQLSSPEPQPPGHSATELEPQPSSQQCVPESQLPQQSAPERQTPNQNALTPQCSHENVTPQLPRESYMAAPQLPEKNGPKSEPSQLIVVKPQGPEMTNKPKPQPPEQSGRKRPRMAISSEDAPPVYFDASPQWPNHRSCPVPLYSSRYVAHHGTPGRPYGVPGLPQVSRPYGPVGTLPTHPNVFVHHYIPGMHYPPYTPKCIRSSLYPRDALR